MGTERLVSEQTVEEAKSAIRVTGEEVETARCSCRYGCETDSPNAHMGGQG